MSNLLFLVEKEGHEAASSPQLLWRSGFAELLHLLCESKGHKKDVVLSATLPANPGKVAIYGWHRPDGQPIQPLSTVLRDSWVGYNHGIRLVDRGILVDGSARDLADVLRDPELAPLLSDDGVMADARYSLVRGER